ncbi:hypothetical protein JCM5350_005412 [Sporobolomyces pararoseus]
MLQQPQTPIETSESRNHRAAPGRRGPVPTSCDRCRKLRVKCIRRLGGRLGEETCTQCEKRSAECTVSNEISHSRKAVTPRQRSTSLAISPPAEQTIIRRQVSGAKANRFFDLYFDPTVTGCSNFIPLCLHDTVQLRVRFENCGKNLHRLERNDQVLFVEAAQRSRSIHAKEDGSTAIEILKSAQEAADKAAIWRQPTRPNLTSLLLLFWVTASGDLTSIEAKHYLSAACSHFSRLFTDSGSLRSVTTDTLEWLAWTVPIIDATVALETRTLPNLSKRDTSVLSHETVPNYLPPLDLIASFLPSQPAKIVAMCSHSVPFYVYSARLLAHLAVESITASSAQRDFDNLEQIWSRMDRFNTWSTGALDLLQLSKTGQLTLTTESMIKNREGMYLLVGSAGHQFSVLRLQHLANTLFSADVDDWDFFPLGLADKLASVTFFIRTLESAQKVYACSELSKPIAVLELVQKELERRTGYSGESALTFFTSISVEILPDEPEPESPPAMSAQVAVSIYRGSSS